MMLYEADVPQHSQDESRKEIPNGLSNSKPADPNLGRLLSYFRYLLRNDLLSFVEGG